jgi:drug/metabolite transporter (DMT)-like permease
MTWPLLALVTAFCQSGQDLVARSLLRRFGLSVRLVMGAGCLVAVVLGLPVALAGGPRPQAAVLVGARLATALVNGLAFWAYGRALRCGELSLVLPLTNLSPLVLLGSGWWLLGEKPGPLALAGVLLLVLGAPWLCPPAVQRTAVVPVIAIKRLSTLLSAAAGGLLYGEARPLQRLPAVALMLIGAVLVLGAAAGGTAIGQHGS